MIPLLVTALLVAASPYDTVLTVDGGRVVGNVLEESPTSGVTVQSPDGTVRRIAAGQVARIEFSDGTVSEPRAAAPAPAATPAPIAPAHVPAGPPDTIFFAGGGRARGTVIQEDPRTGVKMRLLDGSLHTYPPEEFSRIEYGDGTVSRRKGTEPSPSAAPPPPRQEPVPAARAPAPEPALDSIFFIDGGRVRGTVIEDHPTTGVRVRQLDGSFRTYQREELDRIEYSDGTITRRKAKAPPAVTPPPPATAPPPPPPEKKATLVPIYLTLGGGLTWFGGNAASGVPMSQVFANQGHISSEFGVRLSPAWAIGIYGDAGGGDVAASIRQQCQVQSMGMDCVGMAGRLGFLVRHTWSPLEPVSKWLTLGTGWEVGNVSVNNHQSADLFTYSGRELVRIGAGFDFRSNEVIGIGMYASFSWGEYDQYKDSVGPISLDQRTHTTGQVGLRLTLFP